MSIQDGGIRVRLREAIDAHFQRTGVRLTYAALASAAGVSVATLESLGSRSGYNATLNTVGKLCRALHCSPGELLEIVPEKLGKPE